MQLATKNAPYAAMQQMQQNLPGAILARLKALEVVIEVSGDKLRMKPTPPGDVLELVKENKAGIIAELIKAAMKTTTFPELPSIVFWLTKTGAIYKGDRFLRMGKAESVRDDERYSGIVLTTMPAREERFRVPHGAIAWQAGDDIRSDTWRPLKELPKAWRE